MVNIRQKGQQGERDVQKIHNDIIISVREKNELQPFDIRDLPFQRNQNQSAVGGDDLTNPFRLCIEVKRQEALSIGSWWRQCMESAARSGGIPILIFKQSHKAWRVMLLADIPLQAPGSTQFTSFGPLPVEMNMDHYKKWFEEYYMKYLYASGELRTTVVI